MWLLKPAWASRPVFDGAEPAHKWDSQYEKPAHVKDEVCPVKLQKPLKKPAE